MNGLKVLRAQILSELESMRKLLDEATEIAANDNSNINIRAGGSVLHDFYSGAENIFHAIAGAVDERIPSGMSWHVELLNQMTLNIEGVRSPVISRDTAKALEEYLRFRHLFRKRYGFDLEWAGIKRLLGKLPHTFDAVEQDLKSAFGS